jgi:uncharacterized protein
MSYKLSYYTEFSDPFGKDKSHRMGYAVRSGVSYVFNNSVYNSLVNGKFEKINEGIFNELCDNEFIVPANQDEFRYVEQQFHKKSSEQSDTLYFVIHPFAGCQLNCHYCGQKHQSSALNDEDIPNILARVTTKIEKKPYKILKIGWFGGEPVIGIEFIKKLTPFLRAIAEQHNCRYVSKMVTNGQLLTAGKFATLFENGVTKFEITIDGPKEIHDKRRITKTGYGSFDDIIHNLYNITSSKLFLDNKDEIEISVRTNVDSENYQQVLTIPAILEEKGILEHLSMYYFAPVYSWGNDADKKSLQLEDFSKLQIELMIKLMKKGRKDGILPKRQYDWDCVMHKEDSEVIDANGDISCCTEVSYVPVYNDSEYYLGNINKPEINGFAQRPLKLFYQRVFNENSPCNGCKVLPICGGSCTKQINENRYNCTPVKYNLKERLLLLFYSDKEKYSLTK